MTADQMQLDMFPTEIAVRPPCDARRYILRREDGRLVLRCLECEAEIKDPQEAN